MDIEYMILGTIINLYTEPLQIPVAKEKEGGIPGQFNKPSQSDKTHCRRDAPFLTSRYILDFLDDHPRQAS